MKKSSLTTAVVAGIAGVAGLVSVSNAINVNPDGLGQVLIYPYYTVNGGNATLVSVVNTTDDVKAVKVRFLEGRNSQEVLDFNLYLSPFDVWTGAVTSQGDDGPAYLETSDTSCTVPNVLELSPVAFRNYQYTTTNDDDGPYELERTREGHIEVIEMGRVVDDGDISSEGGSSVSAVDLQANPAPYNGARLAFNAIHVDGTPRNCDVIAAAWNVAGGQWGAFDPNLDMDTPNGGLFGGAAIIDVANGTNLTYNADAIEGFFVSESSQNLHFRPGSTLPSLIQAQSSDLGNATAVIFDNGTLYQMDFTGELAGLRAVSAIFMHNEIYNEYVTSAGIGAESEWVVTFPTKRLHIDEATLPAILPFRQTYQGGSAPTYGTLAGACEPISIGYWDREEGEPTTPPTDIEFSPEPPVVTPPGLNLCFEAQVITFNQEDVGEVLFGNEPSAVLGSFYARNLNLGEDFNEGWVRMTLGNAERNFLFNDLVSADPTDPNILVGLPATGFWVANYVNGNAEPGTLANYSSIHRHRADRDARFGTVSIITNDEDVVTNVTYDAFSGS